MKFQPGQKVIVLDTTNKPAGTATIIACNEDERLYKVIFTYYNSDTPEEIDVPEYRLITNSEIINSITK